MKNIHKYLLSIIVVITFFVMSQSDIFHQHNHQDSYSHPDCPVCTLNNIFKSITIISLNAIVLIRLNQNKDYVPIIKISLFKKLFVSHSSDRAPPIA